MEKRAIIILIRNPVLGCVKTRLAADIGKQYALKVYMYLLNYTRSITKCINSSRLLFYSDFIDHSDDWDNEIYEKHLQSGSNFGEKMLNAFKVALSRHQLAVIIGSDCFELTSEVIDLAFQKLGYFDAVLGPATDGGYYLLGLKNICSQLFQNKSWSTNSVLSETIKTLKDLNLSYYLLPTLSDIDTIHNLKDSSLYSQLDIKSRKI
jgi:rSAM/selenodomain-associated transferase 1